MTIRRCSTPLRFIVLTLALLAALPADAQEAREPPNTFERNYDLKVLEGEAAKALVWEACPDEGRGSWCRVKLAGRRLMVMADAQTQAKVAAAIAAAEDVPASQVFQVILLEAVSNGDAGLSKIPSSARQALEDAREFLPYSGYQMLGMAFLRTDQRATSVVNGPDGVDYRADLIYTDVAARDGHRLDVRQFSLDRLASARPSSESAIETIPVISTSFNMRRGETVIVGTSKLEGAERALVVLLTNVQ